MIREYPDGFATQALWDVVNERARQKVVENWTYDHDDQHTQGELARAAATYALHSSLPETYRDWTVEASSLLSINVLGWIWPRSWSTRWWKPAKSRRRDLVKAGALILAELERIDRAEEKRLKTSEQHHQGGTDERSNGHS